MGDINASLGGVSGMALFWCMLIGLGAHRRRSSVITEYYTGTNYKPGEVDVAKPLPKPATAPTSSQGLAVSALKSTALPTLVICGCAVDLRAATQIAGVIGIAFGATSMLALAGMVVALDAYGPDHRQRRRHCRNERVSMQGRCARRTDALDAVGNTTKAVTKGYAIGSAAPRRARALRRLHAPTWTGSSSPTLTIDFSLVEPVRASIGLLLGAPLAVHLRRVSA